MTRHLIFMAVFLLFGKAVTAQFNCGDTLYDSRDHRAYPTVKLGNHCWMAKNLNAGIMLDVSSGNIDQTINGTAEKYCYNSDTNNCNQYGGLYQWQEVMSEACPAGWHLPSKQEFDSLLATFPANKTVKELLPGGSSGFNLLFSGYGYYSGSKWIFNSLGGYVNLRASDEGITSSMAVTYYTYPSDSVFHSDGSHPKKSAYSARCVMDIPVTSTRERPVLPYELKLNYNNGILNVTCPIEHTDINFTIYDISGKTIWNQAIRGFDHTQDLHIKLLNSGIYLGLIQCNNGAEVTARFSVP